MGEQAEVSLKPELVSKVTFLYASTIASAIFSYIAIFFAINFVGDEEYNTLSVALSFAGLFLFVTDLGLGTSHIKKVSEGEDLQSCLSSFMIVRLILVAAFSAIVVAMLFIYVGVLGQGFGRTAEQSAETQLVIMIILLYYAQTSITYVFTSTLLAQRDVFRAQVVALSDVAVRALATLLVVAMKWGLVGLACTYAVEGFVALMVALYLARGRLPKIRLSAAKKSLIKQYFRFAAPLIATTVFGTIALYGDKLLIQYSSTGEVETGIYNSYQRMLSFYLALSPVIASVAYPAFSQLNARKDSRESISRMTTTMIRYLMLATIPMTLFLVVFSKDITSIFIKESFSSAAAAFAILAIGYSIGMTISPFGSQTLGMGMSGTYGKYQMTSVVAMLALDIVLIPSELFSMPLMGWGLNGAAVSLLAGQVILAILFYANARKLLQLKAPRGIVGTACAATIAVLVTYAVGTFVEISRFYDMIALFLVFAAAFVAFAVLFRAITVKELRELLNMLRQKNLLHRPHKQ